MHRAAHLALANRHEAIGLAWLADAELYLGVAAGLAPSPRAITDRPRTRHSPETRA